MKTKTKISLGWIILLIISFFPVFLWMNYGTEHLGESITHDPGEISGLVGMTMFALTFILSTRIKWIEDIFGGLDKVYITHAILGGIALITILAHPILLVMKFVPKKIDLAAAYLLPSSYWSVNFGIIALLGMIILIFITLFTKMKYNKWKFTHEFLGVIFILAVLHIFLVRNSIAQDNIFDGYFIYAAVVFAIGLFGFSYSLFLKNRLFKNAVYSIKSIQQQDDYFKIIITPEHKPINYKAGQFIFVRFYNKNISKEAHPFSIASGSNEKEMAIIIKKLGDYTSKLSLLNKGDKVSVEGPYGRFDYKKYTDKDQVWISGGIGITPFISMAQDLPNDKTLKGNITLFYSARKEDDFINKSLFNRIMQLTTKFKFVPWNSNQQGHLTIKNIHQESGRLKDKEFFLCGPAGFKNSIITALLKQGVNKNNIHEEIFDLR